MKNKIIRIINFILAILIALYSVMNFDISVVQAAKHEDQWYLDAIFAMEARETLEKIELSKVQVAVLDSGLNMNHQEFVGLVNKSLAWDVIRNKPLSGDYLNVAQSGGHGTKVTGVLAGNGIAIESVAGQNVELIPVNVVDNVDLSMMTQLRYMIEGFKYIEKISREKKTENLRVISISNSLPMETLRIEAQETGENYESMVDELESVISRLRSDYGILTVAAGGNIVFNEGKGPTDFIVPSDFDSVIGVTATNKENKNVIGFCYNEYKDISAPGIDIISTVYKEQVIDGQTVSVNDCYATKDKGGEYMSGTSFATPMTAGVAGLLWTVNPNFTVDEVVNIIKSTAQEGLQKEFINKSNGNDYPSINGSAGIINAKAAVDEAINRSPDIVYKSDTSGDDGSEEDYSNTENPDNINKPDYFVNKNSIPRLAIISDSKFNDSKSLNEYILHRQKQGYEILRINRNNNETAMVLREKVKEYYYQDPARSLAILIVGDEAGSEETSALSGNGYVPSFRRTTGNISMAQAFSNKNYVSDYFYGDFDISYNSESYDYDYVQEASVGRLPAINEDELSAMVEKIIFMETNAKVVGSDAFKRAINLGPNYLPGQHFDEYLSKYHGITSSHTENTLDSIGAGLVYYSGHGSVQSWQDSFNNAQVNALTNGNLGVYPFVVAGTCYSGSFQYECLGEAFLKNKNGGAIGYIGATQESSADHNVNMNLGNYENNNGDPFYPGIIESLYYSPRICDESYKSVTMGEALQAGQRAIILDEKRRNYFGPVAKYQIEIYNLLGDPTYMPYISIPQSIELPDFNTLNAGGKSVIELGVSDARVALTKTNEDGNIEILSVAYTDNRGKAALDIPNDASGEATLTVIAQNFIQSQKAINIQNNTHTRSSDTSIEKIEIYDNNTNEHIVTVQGDDLKADIPFEQNMVKIVVFAKSDVAVATGGKNKKLNLGANAIPIKIIAEDGTVKDYILNLTLKPTKLSEDYSLRNISVQSNTGIQEFNNPGWIETVNVGLSDTITISANTNDSKAVCWIEGINGLEVKKASSIEVTINNILDLQGEYYHIYVETCSESGERRSYVLRIYHDIEPGGDDNNNLDNSPIEDEDPFNPVQTPGENPTAKPTDTSNAVTTEPTPTVIPDTNPTATTNPSAKPTATPKPEAENKYINNTEKTIKDGTILTDKASGIKAQVIDDKNKEVSFYAPESKKLKTVKIPSSVKINGNKYKVTKINDGAFKNNAKIEKIVIPSSIHSLGKNVFSGSKNIKTITIKSKNLTKKTVSSKAFKGITKYATIKVPSSKLKTYKKLFKEKGLSSKVKVKK